MIGRPLKEIDNAEVERLRSCGLTWGRVAEALGVNRNTLFRHRRDASIIAGAEDSKRCGGRCGETLPVEAFSVDRSRRDGRNLRCRNCISEQWKENNSSPCVECGSPRRAVTPGLCRHCYQFNAMLKRSEGKVLSLIPSMIAEAERQFRQFTKSLNNHALTKTDRLLAVLTWKPENLNN